jgi:hypothetical protein
MAVDATLAIEDFFHQSAIGDDGHVAISRLVKEVLDRKSGIYSHRPHSFVSHDLITKGNHLPFTSRRSVMTAMLPFPILSMYSPPYWAAHSVNLKTWQHGRHHRSPTGERSPRSQEWHLQPSAPFLCLALGESEDRKTLAVRIPCVFQR